VLGWACARKGLLCLNNQLNRLLKRVLTSLWKTAPRSNMASTTSIRSELLLRNSASPLLPSSARSSATAIWSKITQTTALTSTPVRFIMYAAGQTVTCYAATDAERPAMSGATNTKCGNATSFRSRLMCVMAANT